MSSNEAEKQRKREREKERKREREKERKREREKERKREREKALMTDDKNQSNFPHRQIFTHTQANIIKLFMLYSSKLGCLFLTTIYRLDYSLLLMRKATRVELL